MRLVLLNQGPQMLQSIASDTRLSDSQRIRMIRERMFGKTALAAVDTQPLLIPGADDGEEGVRDVT